MKKITLLLSFIACVLVAQAQLLVNENFDYPIGSAIISQGWNKHSGTVTPNDSILVVDGLTFPNYPGSGVGGAAALTGINKDQNKSFTAQTSGIVYTAFLMKASNVNRPGYFIHLGPNPIGTTFFSRVWINASGSGMAIGPVVSPATEPAVYSPITANTTYLIVIKSDLGTKISSLFILSSVPATEPASAQSTYTETAMVSIGSVALRQYSYTGAPNNQNVIVDGIRIATSWAALFTTSGVHNPSINGFFAFKKGNELFVNNVANGSTVEIFTAIGSKIQTSTLENGSIVLNNLSKGLYIVRVGKDTQKIML